MSETIYGQGTFVNNQTIVTGNGYISLDLTDTGPYLIPSTFPIQGTLYGSVSYVTNAPSPNPTAVSFPGSTGSYINLGTNTPTNINMSSGTVSLFIEAWIYVSTVVTNSAIIERPHPSAGADNYGLFINAGNCAEFFVNHSASTTTAQGQTPLTAGSWWHIAGSYNASTKQMYVFTNGTVGITVGTGGGTPLYTASFNTEIGYNRYYNKYFNGYIEDIRVINNGVRTTTFTPDNAPFSSTVPSYVTGGTNVFNLLPQFNFSYNTDLIKQWLQKTVNSYGIPFWSNPYFYSTIVVSTGSATSSYGSATVIPDGRIVFCPNQAPSVGVFNPTTNQFTSYGALLGTKPFYSGGVLIPDGRVLFAPFYNSSIGFFNPVTNAFSNVVISNAGAGQYNGGVLLPDGRVVFVPFSASNVGLYNTLTSTFSVFTTGVQTGNKYNGGVLLPDGRVVFVPGDTGWIGVFNSATNTYTTYTSAITGINQYGGGVLLPNGDVMFVPWTTTNGIAVFNPTRFTTTFFPSPNGFYTGLLLPDGRVFMSPISASYSACFDPVTGTVSQQALPLPGTIASGAHLGCTLSLDGRIITSPYNLSSVGIFTGLNRPPPRELCLHPFFNKF